MIQEIIEVVSNIAGIILIAAVIVRMVPLLRVQKGQLTTAFFLFAMLSLMLTYAYWLAYTLIRPDVRMPLAANMIGECAIFLLLSATLESIFRNSWRSAKWHIVFTLIFAAASIALWIVWSGEWIQDIIGGIVYAYYLCVCVRSLKAADAFSKKEWIMIGIVCIVIIAAWVAWSYVPESLVWVTLLIGYAGMYALTFFFMYRSVIAVRKNTDPEHQMALSFSAYAWCMSAMYMSSDYYYAVSFILCILTIPLMYMSTRRVVRGEVEHI